VGVGVDERCWCLFAEQNVLRNIIMYCGSFVLFFDEFSRLFFKNQQNTEIPHSLNPFLLK